MEIFLACCTVRSWQPSDAPALAFLANDRSIWINLRDRFPHPYTLAHAEAFISHCTASTPETSFAITVDGQLAGAIGLTLGEDIYRVSAEIGYWLGAAWRGQGIGTDALSGVASWAFGAYSLTRIHAAVFTHNVASARVLEKAGFVRESVARRACIKDGQVQDEFVYAMVR